jgi:hypothetical protein
VIEIERHLFS